MTDFLAQAFENADDPMWKRIIGEAAEAGSMPQGVAPEVYAAAFGTHAGRQVLEDMMRRYVCVTRAIPGEGSDAAFYREGMAQVVFDIISNISEAHGGEDD